jgi:hypothetical protein
MRKLPSLIGALACLAAASCASGGSRSDTSMNGSLFFAPAPAPQAPAGPPAPLPPPVFDPSAPHESFAVVAITVDYHETSLPPPNLHQSGTAQRQGPASDPVIRLVIPAMGLDTTIQGRRRTEGFGTIGSLNYVSFGEWTRGDLTQRTIAVFTFGHETPLSEVPKTGTAKYSGIGTVHARVFFPDDGSFFAGPPGRIYPGGVSGDAALSADFVSGKIEGMFLNMKGDVWNTGFDAPWNDVAVYADIAAGTNRFSGTTVMMPSSFDSPVALKGTGAGSIDGAFYGPNAANLGATWTLSDGTRTVIGAVGAQRN